MDANDNHSHSFRYYLKRLFSPLIMDPFYSFQRSPIKGAFYLHFVLFTCSMLTLDWLPGICYMYNILFLLCLLWALESKDNPEPLHFAAIINLLGILFDIIAMSVNFNLNHYRNGIGFSIFLCVCNILIRPFTSFILLQQHSDRDIRQTLYGGGDSSLAATGATATTGSGIHNPNYNIFPGSGGVNRYGYQDIDNQPQPPSNQQLQNSPKTTATTTTPSLMPYQSSIPEPIIDNTPTNNLMKP